MRLGSSPADSLLSDLPAWPPWASSGLLGQSVDTAQGSEDCVGKLKQKLSWTETPLCASLHSVRSLGPHHGPQRQDLLFPLS